MIYNLDKTTAANALPHVLAAAQLISKPHAQERRVHLLHVLITEDNRLVATDTARMIIVNLAGLPNPPAPGLYQPVKLTKTLVSLVLTDEKPARYPDFQTVLDSAEKEHDGESVVFDATDTMELSKSVANYYRKTDADPLQMRFFLDLPPGSYGAAGKKDSAAIFKTHTNDGETLATYLMMPVIM